MGLGPRGGVAGSGRHGVVLPRSFFQLQGKAGDELQSLFGWLPPLWSQGHALPRAVLGQGLNKVVLQRP